MAEPATEHEERPADAAQAEAAARRKAALRFVRQFGDPVLKARAMPVTTFDDALVREVQRMGQVMDAAMGVGLAAPQVGISHRVLVYRADAEAPLSVLVNPVVEWCGDDTEVLEEGCLSLEGVGVEVERPVDIVVRAQDERGRALLVEASGFEARVIQHEVDHLDGVLILDRCPRGQKREALRALRDKDKQREASAA